MTKERITMTINVDGKANLTQTLYRVFTFHLSPHFPQLMHENAQKEEAKKR